MIDRDTFQKSLSYFQNNRPKLVPDFQNIIATLDKYCDVSEPVIRCAERLALINEHIHMDEAVLSRAVARNELAEFTYTANELFNANSWYCGIFKSAYCRQDFPLGRISGSLIDMANSLSAAKEGDRVFHFCLNLNDAVQAECFIKLFGALGKYSPGFVPDFLEIMQTKMLSRSWESFERWAERGIDLLTSGRVDEGVAFLKLQSKISRQMMDISHTTIHDLKNVLNIYTSSLAGKSMNILDLDASSFYMKTTYTDGKSIFLPPVINFFNDDVYNERAYTALTAHQAATIKYNTYGFDFEAIDFLAELREKYGTMLPNIIENVKRQYGKTAKSIKELPTGEIAVTFPSNRRLLILETEHEKFFYSFSVPDFARELFNLIENARIENRLSRLYSGLERDFRLLNSYIYNTRPQVEIRDRDDLFPMALECLIQYALVKKWKNRETLQGLERMLAEITGQFDRIFEPDADIQRTAEICFRIYNVFSDNFHIQTYCAKNNIHDPFGDLHKPEICPEVILESSPELLKDGGIPALFESEQDTPEKAIDWSSRSREDTEAKNLRLSLDKGEIKLFRYPEYDFAKCSYYEKYCMLYESKLSSESNLFYKDILTKRELLQKKLKKRFLSLQPEEIEVSRKWPDGDEIHLGDAVDFAIDLKRKADADSNIYVKRVRNVRDIAAAILVDASSSTNAALIDTSTKVTHETVFQKIIDIELEALSLLSSALSLIGDTFGIFTFNSMGRHKILYNIVKDYEEPWNEETQGRIASVIPAAANRDGCAIRHTLMRLNELPNKTKLIIMLSDGIPADVKYGSKSSSDTSQYAIEDTRRAIMECRQQGIVPYCITIDKNAKEYIPHLYGNYSYTIIDNIEQLPERLSKLYLRLTR